MKKVIKKETFQRVMMKRRRLREVKDMAVQMSKTAKVQITKEVRGRRKNMTRKKTWMKICLMARREEMNGKTEGEKKKAAEMIGIEKKEVIETKDTAKIEVIEMKEAGRTEMIEDLRRNHVATRRSLLVQGIMIVTVTSVLRGTLELDLVYFYLRTPKI